MERVLKAKLEIIVKPGAKKRPSSLEQRYFRSKIPHLDAKQDERQEERTTITRMIVTFFILVIVPVNSVSFIRFLHV